MKIKIDKIEDFRNIIKVVNNLCKEVIIHITENKMIFFNFLGIQMFKIEIDKEFFEVYKIDAPDKIRITANSLYKILDKTKDDDKLIISFKDEEHSKIVFNVSSNIKKSYELKLFELEEEDKIDYNKKLDKINSPHYLIALSEDLNNALDEVIPTERIIFETTEEYLDIKGEGDLGLSKCRIRSDEKALAKLKVKFNKGTIQRIFNSLKFFEKIRIELDSDYPLKLKMAQSGYRAEYLLAPVVEP